MAVVPRKRKKWTTYYVAFEWQGEPVWENAGRDKREAEALDRRRAKEVKEGTYHPDAGKAGGFTFRQWFESWIKTREIRSKVDEERWVRRHVLTRSRFADKRIDEWKPSDTADLERELRTQPRSEKDHRPLAASSITNALGVLSVCFGDAHLAEHVSGNPIALKRKRRKDAESKKEIYTVGELVVLIRNEAIDEGVRVLNALCFLAGLREGEACGRRWRDLDFSPEPLPCLDVSTQYGGGPLKTDRPRVVPVHPELRAVLEHWAATGFELLMCRKPTGDDFIVPLRTARAKTPHHTRSTFYKAFIRACKAVKVRPRSLHSTRHTFITMARRRAPKDIVERITHNAKGDILDRYTHWEWAPLCEAVQKISLDENAHQALRLPSGNRGGGGGALSRHGVANDGVFPGLPAAAPSSIPGASTLKQHKNRGAVEARQDPRQGGSIPRALQRGIERTSPKTREGVLVRRLAKATDAVLRGDERMARAELRRAERAAGGRR